MTNEVSASRRGVKLAVVAPVMESCGSRELTLASIEHSTLRGRHLIECLSSANGKSPTQRVYLARRCAKHPPTSTSLHVTTVSGDCTGQVTGLWRDVSP